MAIRYYNLFDLLNRKGMKKSDLREILAPKTIAKLSKGEYINGESIDKLCLFLECQPNEIMEVFEIIKFVDEKGNEHKVKRKTGSIDETQLQIDELIQKRIENYNKIRNEMELEEE